VVHHDIVARDGHSRDCAVKPDSRAPQHITQTGSVEISRLLFGTHGPDHVDTYVKPRGLEVSEELAGDGGLPRTRDAVEQHDLAWYSTLGHNVHSARRAFGSARASSPLSRGRN